MGFLYEARASDSPYLESVTRGRTEGHGSVIRPAERHWHMVLATYQGETRLLVVGPWTAAGHVSFVEGVELLWIKFALGAFMPHMPTKNILDSETPLPGAACHSFWLDSSTWQFPDFENVETFVDRLARTGTLTRDPMIAPVLRGRLHGAAERTVRHRFLRATGLSQGQLRQMERAQHAADLLRNGATISDTIYTLGYCDQPHLTRALKHWVGYTPAQLVRLSQPRRPA